MPHMTDKNDDIKITPDMIEYSDVRECNEVSRFYVYYQDKRYRVQLVSDYDSTPEGEECYSEADIEAWQNDEWTFVGVIVTPIDVPKSSQFGLSDSLWGVEYEFPLSTPEEYGGVALFDTGDRYLTMVHPVPDMIDTVRRQVAAWDNEQAVNNYIYS